MENKQMADYTLTIKADSGYESETEGRCTAEQYGQAIAALHGETSQRKPLTDEQIKQLWRDTCTIDNGKGANLTNQPFYHLCRAIEAAHGIKE